MCVQLCSLLYPLNPSPSASFRSQCCLVISSPISHFGGPCFNIYACESPIHSGQRSLPWTHQLDLMPYTNRSRINQRYVACSLNLQFRWLSKAYTPCHNTFISSINGCITTLIFDIGSLGPRRTKARNMTPSFMHLLGGRLYGIMKTDQHEYRVELLLKEVNPSIDKPR
jgi:hypothetical protein